MFDDGRPTFPFYDPRARVIYALIILKLCLSLLLLHIARLRIDPAIWPLLTIWPVSMVVAGMGLRRLGFSRLGGAIDTTALCYSQGLAALVLLFPIAALSWPFADVSLNLADRAIGFDWLAFASLFRDQPTMLQVQRFCYASFHWQALIVLPVLAFEYRLTRAWRFVTALSVAGLLTAAIFPYFPAVGPYVFFGLEPADYPYLQSETVWKFGEVIHRLQSGTALITKDMFIGLVALPSYHTSAAVLLAWAAWPLRLLRWPSIILNVGMAASSIIIGGHYFVDIPAGAAVGLAALYLSQRIIAGPDQDSAVSS